MARDFREQEQQQYHHQQARRRNSGGGMAIIAIAIALVFIIGPFAAPITIPSSSQLMLAGFGVMLLLVGGIVLIITRLYRRAPADEAFVRTGMGGAKPIVDGGALVIPVVHEVIPVSLATMKLVVERHGENALITGDNLRADVTAEFYIRVMKKAEDVLAAATSLGERATNPSAVKDVLFEKLVNALRTVGATKDLNDLHRKRDEFAEAVQKIVTADLKHNGFTLESTTISRLDQTPLNALRAEDNVFDAQGKKKIAEVIQAAKIETNRITREAELAVAKQDTETTTSVAQQEIARETAVANKERDVSIAKVVSQREAAERAAQEQQKTEVAVVEKNKTIEIAKVEKEKAVEVAAVDKDKNVKTAAIEADKAVKTADIEREQTVEVSKREMQITVANKETERARAETTRQEAEAGVVEAQQKVQTVAATAEAERKKEVAVIAKRAEAETKKISDNTQADIKAYEVTATAKAEKDAADNQAGAKLTLAKAEKEAAALKAEGDTAIQMVPVNVDKAKVEVQRIELENKDKYKDIASALTVKLAEVEASKEVQIAMASAVATMLSSAKITLWGTPEQMQTMTQSFLKGQSMGTFVNGMLAGPDGNINVVGQMAAMLAAGIEKATGVKITPEKAAEALAAITGNGAEAAAK